VEVNGKEEPAYLPNSGRLQGVLSRGSRVLLVKKQAHHRKTNLNLILAYKGDTLISVDARVPNQLIYEALVENKLPEFKDYCSIKREVKYGKSRFDLLLTGGTERLFIEVKSVTLVREGVALFPDAPTERGVRHLRELLKATWEGYRAAIVFCVQRNDAHTFSPNDDIDPLFGQVLRRAKREGISLLAYACKVSLEEITIARKIPVVC